MTRNKHDMGNQDKKAILKELQSIPGVGPRIAEDFFNLGFYSPESLRGQDAEDLYSRLCMYQGVQVDRCMLYVFRCAVYYVSNNEHEPELLKWWNWKDKHKRGGY